MAPGKTILPFLPFLSLLSLLLLSPLPSALSALLVNGCVPAGQFKTGVNYFSTAFAKQDFVTHPATSRGFSVVYRGFYKVVRDKFAGNYYVLWQCGTRFPTAAELKRDNVPAGALTLQVPFKACGMQDDTTAVFLQLLGALPRLKTITAHGLVDSCLQKLQAKLPSNPGLVATIPFFGEKDPYDPSAVDGMYIPFSATADADPLRRAEWVQFLATFFNAETIGAAVYQAQTRVYECVKARGGRQSSTPLTVWVSFYQGVWTLSGAAYKQQYVRDAGGSNPANLPSGGISYNASKPADMLAFKTLLKKAYVVIDETYLPEGPPKYSLAAFKANAQISTAEEGQYKFLTDIPRGNVWSIYGLYNKDSFYTAWYEGAVAQPHLVLEELQVLMHPQVVEPRFRHTFFYNIATKVARLASASTCKAKNPAIRTFIAAVKCSIQK